MCEMSQTEEGTFLHICSFPPFFFAETNLKVVEHNTNATLYNRTVYMDELSKAFLLTNPLLCVYLSLYSLLLHIPSLRRSVALARGFQIAS